MENYSSSWEQQRDEDGGDSKVSMEKPSGHFPVQERDEPHSYRTPSLDGELLLFMGAAALMKMAVEMAAVSMEKPSGHFPVRQVPERDSCPPDLGFAMAAAGRFRVPWLPP
ncbi:hypothetical protein QYE76_045499 [Lolium multiflorum]|uniref:Uncharacterized protein n=1 Tax=Lolium multiflorum TaxID=4521 RepID=A0AAD8TLI4_LOLMU|nr:hypothetical protein QYE76_045499 [Lolium multiflorum]